MEVKLVTIGHILHENIVFADGRRQGPVLGSCAAYCSVVSARLGVPTGIVTKVGPDAPAIILQPLKDAEVDSAGIDFGSSVTTTNELVYGADGTKELKYLKQAGPITFENLPESYYHADAFHICPLDYEVSLDTVSRIARLGKIMCVDLGGYGGAHVCRNTYNQKKFSPAALKDLISCFDVVKASDEDARLLFANENLSDEESAQRLVDWGAPVGIITRGPKGSLVFTKDKKYLLQPLPGQVIDVTGGGDSYIAGFLVEYTRTGDAWRSAVFASAVALCVIEKTGGVRPLRMPTEVEVRERIPADIKPELL
jgi:sugar/nucleoside kinase (ribokinase family)